MPRLPRGKQGRNLGFLLLRTRSGQVLLLLVTVRFLGALGLVPSVLSTAATVGLWVYAAVVVLWAVAGLRTKLLWRIRRKLIISYLLIGLVPTLLILFFFLIGGYFIIGQVSSYMLNTALQNKEAEASTAAEIALAEVQALAGTKSYLHEREIVDVLQKRLAVLQKSFPGSGAVYLEHRRGRIQRVVTTDGFVGAPNVGTNLPPWLESSYRGPIRSASQSYLGGSSLPTGSKESVSVLVVSPLDRVLEDAAGEIGFHIDQILTSVANEDGSAFVPTNRDPSLAPTPLGTRPFTLPWLTLLQTRNLDEPRANETDLVFVQFGFAPMGLYHSVASNALQLGPDGPDLGQLILFALLLLAVLFFVIEVSAIFVGLVLARSITSSVHALSQGTDRVRQGDFGYKVQVRSRDQLGELADSFNLMTTSIRDLLHQSAEKERLEEELRVARAIQMSLLPKDRVSVPGLSIAALCLPATEVGGDYYDFIPLRNDKLALLIADVSGKGTSAALYMAELKGLVLSLSQIYESPRKLLVEANKILSANLDSRSFITMAYAVIDMKQRSMTYARAGHNPLYHLTPDGGHARTRVIAPDGLGLALDRGAQFEKILQEQSIALRSGDLFLFFTDGLSEAMNTRSELFGEDRLRAVMEENADLPMDELREKIIDEVFNFAGGAVQHDDMTMVLVKVL
ncbi:MAG TPA: SpoIIE family protein phosphatase [Vicinamibacteria bacterium]|nr:SpoIIE family protein phosphatase [Vicinamibacteria bacterium]